MRLTAPVWIEGVGMRLTATVWIGGTSVRLIEGVVNVAIRKSRCVLEAIAAAIYAERVAGVRVGKCPACDKLFEIEAHKEKTFCNRQCQDRMKKTESAKEKALVPPPATG